MLRATHIHPPAESKPDTSPDVDIYHLPKPTTALIGRKTELTQLTEAFINPDKRLAIIVATVVIRLGCWLCDTRSFCSCWGYLTVR